MGLIHRRRPGFLQELRVRVYKRQSADDSDSSPDTPDTPAPAPGQPAAPSSPDTPSPTAVAPPAGAQPPGATATIPATPPSPDTPSPTTTSAQAPPAAAPPTLAPSLPPPPAVTIPPPAAVIPPPAAVPPVAAPPPVVAPPPVAAQPIAAPPAASPPAAEPPVVPPPVRVVPAPPSSTTAAPGAPRTMTAVAPELIKTLPIVLNPEVPTAPVVLNPVTTELPSPTTSTTSIDTPSPTTTTFPALAPPATISTPPAFPGLISGAPSVPGNGLPALTQPGSLLPLLPLPTAGQGLMNSATRPPAAPTGVGATPNNATGAENRITTPEPATAAPQNDAVHAGIALGSIAATAFVFAILFWAWKWRRRNIERYSDPTVDEKKRAFPPIELASRLRERLRWTTTTTTTNPLWGGTIATGTSGDRDRYMENNGPTKSNSRVLDDLFSAAYAAESGLRDHQNGYGGNNDYYPDEKRSSQDPFPARDPSQQSSSRSTIFRWLRSRSAAVTEASMPVVPPTPRSRDMERPDANSQGQGQPGLLLPPIGQVSRWSLSTKKTASYYKGRDDDNAGLVSMYAASRSSAAWPPAGQTTKDKNWRTSAMTDRSDRSDGVPWPEQADVTWEMQTPPAAVTRP